MIIIWDEWFTASGGVGVNAMNDIEERLAAVTRYYWEPMADITVHELAIATPMIAMTSWAGKIDQIDFLDRWYADLPPEVQRHWIVEPPSGSAGAAALPGVS